MATIAADHLALQRLYHWERTAGNQVTLTQPMGGAAIQDFTWAQVGDQVRRMAAFLKALRTLKPAAVTIRCHELGPERKMPNA